MKKFNIPLLILLVCGSSMSAEDGKKPWFFGKKPAAKAPQTEAEQIKSMSLNMEQALLKIQQLEAENKQKAQIIKTQDASIVNATARITELSNEKAEREDKYGKLKNAYTTLHTDVTQEEARMRAHGVDPGSIGFKLDFLDSHKAMAAELAAEKDKNDITKVQQRDYNELLGLFMAATNTPERAKLALGAITAKNPDPSIAVALANSSKVVFSNYKAELRAEQRTIDKQRDDSNAEVDALVNKLNNQKIELNQKANSQIQLRDNKYNESQMLEDQIFGGYSGARKNVDQLPPSLQ